MLTSLILIRNYSLILIFFLYENEISDTIKKYEKHVLYINHYDSYKRITEELWNELQTIDISEPDLPDTIVVDEFDPDKIGPDVERFVKNSARFHAIAKSLVLNCAFMVEAYINILLRAGSYPHVKNNSLIFKKALNHNIKEKIKTLDFYTYFISKPIDFGSPEVQNVLHLMTLRNKYVHSDQSSDLNLIEEVYFDRDYPLFKTDSKRQIIRFFSQMFLVPPFDLVKKSYESAHIFIKYLFERVDDKWKKEFKIITESNPLSYMPSKKIYSLIGSFNHMPIMSRNNPQKEK